MDDRIHFIEHKGKRILLLDFSHATAAQMQLLLEYVRVTVGQTGPRIAVLFSRTMRVRRSITQWR